WTVDSRLKIALVHRDEVQLVLAGAAQVFGFQENGAEYQLVIVLQAIVIQIKRFEKVEHFPRTVKDASPKDGCKVGKFALVDGFGSTDFPGGSVKKLSHFFNFPVSSPRGDRKVIKFEKLRTAVAR